MNKPQSTINLNVRSHSEIEEGSEKRERGKRDEAVEDGRSEYRLITRVLLQLVGGLVLDPVRRRRGDEADPDGTAGAAVVCRRRIIGGADDRGRRRGGR